MSLPVLSLCFQRVVKIRILRFGFTVIVAPKEGKIQINVCGFTVQMVPNFGCTFIMVPQEKNCRISFVSLTLLLYEGVDGKS